MKLNDEDRSDVKAVLLLCCMVITTLVSLIIAITIARETIKDNAMKRCIEYNYECKEADGNEAQE